MAQVDTTRIADRVWAAVWCEPWFDPVRDNIRAMIDQTVATLAGQVANIAVKKRVMRRMATLPELTGIIDHVRVAPTRRMTDDELSAGVLDTLRREPTLRDCALALQGRVRRRKRKSSGRIELAVKEGVVTLNGDVPSLAYKQIAGVLAWWVPGTREVINGLGATSPVENVDEELTDIVSRMLSRDPALDASRIEVSTRNSAVQLLGLVPTASEHDQAEFDAWYVYGVAGVENRIEVAA